MYVVELFHQELIGIYSLYITPVLPELIVFYLRIISTTKPATVHEPFLTTFLLIVLNGLDYAFTGEFFEVTQDVAY